MRGIAFIAARSESTTCRWRLRDLICRISAGSRRSNSAVFCGTNLANLFHSLGEEFLSPLLRRLVVAPALQRIRQAIHIRHAPFFIVRVAVTLAVVELLHQP